MSTSEDEQEGEQQGPSGHTLAQDVFLLYYPLISDLQAAMHTAMEADYPLACACYGADKEGTLRELIAHFKSHAAPRYEEGESGGEP
jgi:hypothetical protein